jgi:hypothetical protein
MTRHRFKSWELSGSFPNMASAQGKSKVHGVSNAVSVPIHDDDGNETSEYTTMYTSWCGLSVVDSHHGQRLSLAPEGWILTKQEITCKVCQRRIQNGKDERRGV